MKVSFIIPTLNRERYVGRAVASCIAAGERAGMPFEVVVLDSQSDDGSWEMLNDRFGGDARVLLRQNRRGLGPTRSWLDGAEFITGDVVTFVWSDDWVADTMLTEMMPPLRAGADVVVGHAIVRGVDDDSTLPRGVSDTASLDADQIALAYYGVSAVVSSPPVSPACALFSRRAFDRWRELILTCAEGDLLVQQLMWRRAIGPDMLLFLVALDMQRGPVTFVGDVVTQFSSHEGSISISSPGWLLRGGYIAARAVALRDAGLFQSFSPRWRAAMQVHTALQLAKLTRGIPTGQKGMEDTRAVAAIATERAHGLISQARREAGLVSLASGLLATGMAVAGKPFAFGRVSMAALT